MVKSEVNQVKSEEFGKFQFNGIINVYVLFWYM